jgi:hypothetical protein
MGRTAVIVKLSLALAAAGCVGGSDELAALEAEASGYTGFDQINARAFATAQHQGNPLVHVWANAAAATPYRALSAGTPSAPSFAVGAMIVKEMTDASGGPSILTVMAKQPAGYDPAHGDWWFGRLTADGRPTSASLVGRVGFCIACHDAAAANDHLFGVSADNLRR